MDAARIAELTRVYRDGLFNDVLPFWTRNAVDTDHGGFFSALDRDGTVIDTDKAVWIQGRFTWLLGELYNTVEEREEWLGLGQHGAAFLDRHGFDPEDGRMWFHLTSEGTPIRKRRYAFSESFAAIAYGELAQATGRDDYAERARACFQRFVDHSLNPQGVQPKFTEARSMQGLGFPMITLVTAQELRDSIGLESATEWIDRSIDTIRRDHINEDLQCVLETVGPGGAFIDHFDGRMLTPGHAMEAAWFIMREGQYRDDDSLIQLGCRILDLSWARGWDEEYGGVLYFVDAKGLPVQEYWHDMKFWWVHNETIIATLLAYHLTGDDKYADWHTKVHDWSYRHFPDPEHGEWYGYLHRDGRISVPLKGNLWKGPFHLPRMQLACWRILQEMAAERSD
jgi:N-acylglucosamine 2-epimerase